MLGSIQMPSKWLPRQSSNSVIQYQCLLCLTSGFISNLQQRVASVQWDVSVSHATLLTLGIGLCVGLLTTLLALWLSLATCWFRITGSKIAIALISSFLLIPLYVQATAWSAGFGSNGWLRLSQVDASKHPRLDTHLRGDAVLLLDPRTRIATNLQSSRRPVDARIRSRFHPSKSASAETQTLAHSFFSMGICISPLRYGRHELVSNPDSLRKCLPTSAIR